MARIRTIKPLFKKKAITAETRREIARRHGLSGPGELAASCHYCGSPGKVIWFPQVRGKGWVAFFALEMDHHTPEFSGGGSGAENLVLACLPCNRSKSHIRHSKWGNVE